MKHIFYILPFLGLLISFDGFSQKISFSYDYAGNRIKKEIILSQQRISSPQEMETSTQPVTDMLADKSIRIHPNPTKGMVKIKIDNLDSDDEGVVYVYSLSGQFITSSQISSSLIDMDLSNRPNGIYILSIQLNGTTSTWKVIKQ
ncbi:MAG: T9SS type A sorting domain-containing protein [Muribaculaceae bacterium]|nr:T9SS type A sorting domain-containing protein [Muribaculaceae bacterium]